MMLTNESYLKICLSLLNRIVAARMKRVTAQEATRAHPTPA
jgi:hypothetical protein